MTTITESEKAVWKEYIKKNFQNLEQMDKVIDTIIEAYCIDPEGFDKNVQSMTDEINHYTQPDGMVNEFTAKVLKPNTEEYEEYLKKINDSQSIHNADSNIGKQHELPISSEAIEIQ